MHASILRRTFPFKQKRLAFIPYTRQKKPCVGHRLLVAYVCMGHPRIASLSVAIQVLKQQTSKKLNKCGETQFWQRRYYDFNVWSERKTREKLGYMHRNPVRRGLVAEPEDWPWSSFRHYATGTAGTVEIESDWTARKRERDAQLPPFTR